MQLCNTNVQKIKIKRDPNSTVKGIKAWNIDKVTKYLFSYKGPLCGCFCVCVWIVYVQLEVPNDTVKKKKKSK